MKNTSNKSLNIGLTCFILTLIFPKLFLPNITLPLTISETIVKVEPYISSANINETFTINITVVNVQNLYGIDITLNWNASILRPLSIDLRLGINESRKDGVLYEPIFIAKNETIPEEGKYLLVATSCDHAPPFNGTGNIVKMTFKVIAAGNCTLSLNTKLADWPPPDREPRISWPIEHKTIDGYFMIPEFPQHIILLAFIILLTLSIILYRKIS
jgi:hypothetical protein